MQKKTTYTHNDVMQAVVAALMFGEDAGLAAISGKDGILFPGASNDIIVSPEAQAILADAQSLVPSIVGKPTKYGLTEYYLTEID